jgi:2-polyprenyl-6-methoxyphenol hydroxylase-like FAD-dependent oxidoreductase
MASQDAPLLVVGARTTGLMMASELARHGAPVRIVDRSPGIDPHCRATGVHARTLEIFQDLGIVEEALAEATPIHGENLYAGGRRFLHARYDGVDSPYRFSVGLPQCRTEAILERHLRALGVSVERRTELVATTPRDDGVRATLRHADGREEVVDTPWLLGCDGAHSTLRHLNRADFPGEEDPHQFVLADVRVEADFAQDEIHIFLTDRGPLFMFPIPEERKLIAADLPGSHDAASETPTLEQIQALVDERGPAGARLLDPRWLSYFRIHYRVARHYRFGRTFLAGDAVHIHSLIGGQGMNTGIQDAYNLAWKLALVARGRAPESLLESYERERRKVAEDVVATTRAMTERAEVFPDLSPAQREKLCRGMVAPEPERRRMARHVEEIDLDYRSSPICAESGALADGPHAGAQAPDVGSLRVGAGTLSLFELLRGPRHTLLLFAGSGPVRKNLPALAAEAFERCGDWMQVCLVCSGKGPEPAVPPGAVLVRDPEQALHHRYGAAEGDCLYLIRPDGYVGYRGRPASSVALRAYLDRVF